MRAVLRPGVLSSRDQDEAASILRACVHCGFCNATCPSYQVLGDERDGPRGRIYLMKHVLEGGGISLTTQTHLDRCLGCRACETTCPSGVRYTRLFDLMRAGIAARAPRNMTGRLFRRVLRLVVPRPALFGLLLGLGRAVRVALPPALRKRIPPRPTVAYGCAPSHDAGKKLALLRGCVQETATPQINQAAIAVLSRLGIRVEADSRSGCCGALALHLGAEEEAKAAARRNIEAWFPRLVGGEIEGIFSASSGCTQVLKDYGHLLRDDPVYAPRAARVAAAVRDASESITAEEAAALGGPGAGGQRVAFQCPCSLQHGLKGQGRVESLLRAVGYTLSPVADPHLCCGSAGTYSLLQPAVADELLSRKLAAVETPGVTLVATANVGCQLHLARESRLPVKHWLELLADAAGCRVGQGGTG